MNGGAHPLLYQINTRVWLTELGRGLGHRATLDDIPDGELDRFVERGFDPYVQHAGQVDQCVMPDRQSRERVGCARIGLDDRDGRQQPQGLRPLEAARRQRHFHARSHERCDEVASNEAASAYDEDPGVAHRIDATAASR